MCSVAPYHPDMKFTHKGLRRFHDQDQAWKYYFRHCPYSGQAYSPSQIGPSPTVEIDHLVGMDEHHLDDHCTHACRRQRPEHGRAPLHSSEYGRRPTKPEHGQQARGSVQEIHVAPSVIDVRIEDDDGKNGQRQARNQQESEADDGAGPAPATPDRRWHREEEARRAPASGTLASVRYGRRRTGSARAASHAPSHHASDGGRDATAMSGAGPQL